MTPLTHGAVGLAIFQKLRPLRVRAVRWIVAFVLAWASHYALDRIPHFEDIGGLEESRTMLLYLGMGAVGIAIGLILWRWSPRAGLIWLVYSIWLALGSNSYPLLRIPTAALAIGFVGYVCRDWEAPACLLSGILAASPDVILFRWQTFRTLHSRMHFHISWALRLHRLFSHSRIPVGLIHRLEDPYYLLGYSLEILVEVAVFLGAIYWLIEPAISRSQTEMAEAEATLAPTAGTQAPRY